MTSRSVRYEILFSEKLSLCLNKISTSVEIKINFIQNETRIFFFLF